MNYWSGMFNFLSLESPIDTILKEEGCALEKLLDVEDFIQEIRTNEELINFCCEKNNLKKIVQYALGDIPKGSTFENTQKYGSICASLFGDEPTRLVKSIGKSEEMINYLFNTIMKEEITKVRAASQILLSMYKDNTSIMFDMLINNEEVLEKMINHPEIDGLIDNILELMKLEDSGKTGYIDKICNHQFINKIMTIFMTTQSVSAIENISLFIHSIVLWKVSNTDSDTIEFINKFNNDVLLPQFIDFIFNSQDDFVVSHAFHIVSNILACSTIITYSDETHLPGIFNALFPHVKDFENIMKSRRVGSVTNNLIYIILSMVLSGFHHVYDVIANENVLGAMMDVFYGDHLCTVVRQTIQMTVLSILNTSVEKLKLKLIDDGKLLDIMKQKDIDAVEIKKNKNIAPDYWLIGSLLMVALVNSVEGRDDENTVKQIVMGNKDFIDYVHSIVMERETEKSEYFSKPTNGDFSDEFEEEEDDDYFDDSNEEEDDHENGEDFDDQEDDFELSSSSEEEEEEPEEIEEEEIEEEEEK
ncbi:hypothetical protein EDI_110980 [Entamoeba dispar SAW760]|uniref:Uncharacterized protein n=1 Tax=Entamoeba dispar (strain ATCC PRA-260 / SAW760) TaxID=370354 RepID=B0E719_ENTDS|nr:uncharacterized protein EDI_110980 [Entamoeba dispar SAW760]EDR29678.1 hypothetical protein EDI_110980 [Entamoeba dispar SAW760]|eukprot:EDR29678.1 hypothetical protein EDI_110980 [Entamoeba dispar SAW760]